MSKNKQTSPLNVLVGIAGVAFGLTACAYGLLIVLELRSTSLVASQEGFVAIMRQYGGWLLLGELAVLGISSMAAIGLDSRKKEAPGNEP